MMKFKRAIVFVLCMVLALPLAACGKKGTNTPTPGPGPDNSDKTYTITFDLGPEHPHRTDPNYKPIDKTVKHGEKIDFLATPADFGDYVFDGWYENNVRFTTDTVVTKNWNLTAKWGDASALNEEARAYESNIETWDQPGHLYIHYKRYDHKASEQSTAGTPTNGVAPKYDNAISSDVYGDWGLWIWPKNEEGRLFNPAWIDVSGAVYDILLDNTYDDAGWDENTLTHKDINVNYKKATSIGIQLFQISSRLEAGFWANDGGNNYITPGDIVRSKGSYHWFVSQGRVGSGKKTFGAETLRNPYADIPAGSATTRATGDGMINSTADNKVTFPVHKTGVQNFDANNGYQIFVASFADGIQDDPDTPLGQGMGDLRGIINKIDENYFQKLGIDMLWLTPFQTSTNYHGYDIKDFYSVDPRFGTLADYRELVYKAHQKGMRIVMDLVLNHTSQANPWFVKSQNLEKEEVNGKVIDYRQFYSWINQEKYDSLSAEDKKQWYGDSYGYYFYSSFSSDQPELNYDYQPVRDAILDVCNYWMEFGLDGFRLDAVKHIYMVNEIKPVGKNPSGAAGTQPGSAVIADGSYSHDVTRNLNFYHEFNYRLKANYPNAFVVGENLDGWNERTAPYYEGMDSQFDFNTYYAARSFNTIRGIPEIKKDGTTTGQNTNENWMGAAFTTYLKGYDAFKDINPKYIGGQFTSNHDLPRARNRMALRATDGGETDAYSAITGSLINDSYNSLFLYYGMIMSLPGVTWTYYGDEIGMEGIMQTTINSATGSTDTINESEPHEDRIYRQPMKWNASDNASYSIGFNDFKSELTGINATASVKSVTEQMADADSLWNWVAKLNGIRKSKKLGNGTKVTDNGSGGNKISFKVTGGNGSIMVTIVAGGSKPSASGALAEKTVTIGGKQCHIVIANA